VIKIVIVLLFPQDWQEGTSFYSGKISL